MTRFWPNDIYRIAFGGGHIDIGVSKDFVLNIKVKGSGEDNAVSTHYQLSEEDAKECWVELYKLFREHEDES